MTQIHTASSAEYQTIFFFFLKQGICQFSICQNTFENNQPLGSQPYAETLVSSIEKP